MGSTNTSSTIMRDTGSESMVQAVQKKNAKGRKNSYQPNNPDTKKGRKSDEDLNGNFVKNGPKLISNRSSSSNSSRGKPRDFFLKPWTAPEWVPKDISTIPQSKVKLVSGVTDIEPWFFDTFNKNCPNVELFIKRDDNTGSALTGNKVRKLEFLLACARLGLDCHLLLTMLESDINLDSGNVCLAIGAGAKLYQIGHDGVDEKMAELADELVQSGKRPYVIPRGGSNGPSIWGYIETWREMETQPFFDEVTDIVVCSGSGGTGLDVALANYWTGSKKKVHGVRVWGDSKYFYQHATESMEEAGIHGINPRKIIDIIDGHVGEGYGKSSGDLREFCISALSETGIVLDRVYTGKSVYGLMNELRQCPQRFKGNKIMWIHTGGMSGFLDRSMDAELVAYNPIRTNYFD